LFSSVPVREFGKRRPKTEFTSVLSVLENGEPNKNRICLVRFSVIFGSVSVSVFCAQGYYHETFKSTINAIYFVLCKMGSLYLLYH
jgi:hypothetical protein